MKTFVIILLLLILGLFQCSFASAKNDCVPVCDSGYLCHEGVCKSPCIPECTKNQLCVKGRCETGWDEGRQLDLNQYQDMEEKSAAASWALEFFIGFGAGHYYSGQTGWGIFGTLSSVFLVTGAGLTCGALAGDSINSINGDLFAAGMIIFLAGEIGHTVSWIAAPIVTSMDNKKKRAIKMQYQKSLLSDFYSSTTFNVTKISPKFRNDQVHLLRQGRHTEKPVIIQVLNLSF